MFLLLLVAAVIYFILGEPRDGAIMLVFVIGIISIDVIQEWKTDKTLSALRDLSAPHVRVIRDGVEQEIASVELVPGDLMLIHEGVKIPADGKIVACNDLCADESSLTGEAEGVWKTAAADTTADYWRKDQCYAGTLVTQGNATVQVTQTGARTEYGKIGMNVASAPEEPTPLQRQTGSLVKLCAGIAAVLFALVGVVTYINIPDHMLGARLIESFLSGITLAMAMIPEEVSRDFDGVSLHGRMAAGQEKTPWYADCLRWRPWGPSRCCAWDKTGTITMNQMTVQDTWSTQDDDDHLLVETMGLACETDAYDPMEKAMLTYCDSMGITKEHLFSGELISEYAFTNALKMMGHVWRRNEQIIVAAKGSPERILPLCSMTDEQRELTQHELLKMSKQGLRVIAVGEMGVASPADIPSAITDCTLTLCGLVGLADPPRETVEKGYCALQPRGHSRGHDHGRQWRLPPHPSRRKSGC